MLTINPALQKGLEGKLQSEEVNNTQEDTGINNFRTINQKEGNSLYNNKTTGTNKHCSLITLNINGLNFPIKKDKD